MSITAEPGNGNVEKTMLWPAFTTFIALRCPFGAKSFQQHQIIALTFVANFNAMLKMLFMLAVIYIAYRLFTYQPSLPGRKPQDHIRNPHQNEPGKQGRKTNSKYDDDYIDYEELK